MNAIATPITPATNRYGLREFSVGDIVSYTSIQGRTSYGEIVSILRNYDTKDASRIKYEVRFEGSTHTVFHIPTNLRIDPLNALRKLNAAYLAWETAWLAGTDKALIARLSAEHDALHDAHMASIGAPPKSLTQTQGNTTRVVYSESGYDMEDDSETTFDADDFLGPVSKKPVAVAPVAAPVPVSMTVTHGQQRTGRVSCYNEKHDFGYIASKEYKFYFRRANLLHSAMEIKGGDTVTFTVYASREGMPRAMQITKPDYVPVLTPAQAAQKSEEQARIARQEQEDRRKAKRAEDLARQQAARDARREQQKGA